MSRIHMAVYPKDFTPDLRRLKSWPSMEDSPWRQPYLADLTYGELHRLINEFVIGHGLRILDVGCGTGFLSLELAREGHRVTGVDNSEDMINIAVRTMKSDPYGSERGSLEYKLADFTTLENPESEFDLVIISRTLHHIPQPMKVLDKARKLLREEGRLVCVEFAYDQFDEETATWLYQTEKTLEDAGLYRRESKFPSSLHAATSQILESWFEEYEKKEKFNKFEEMRKPLYTFFREDYFSWEPYLYWEIISRMRVSSNQTELEMARGISAMEQALIQTQQIKPVLFCFVGTRD